MRILVHGKFIYLFFMFYVQKKKFKKKKIHNLSQARRNEEWDEENKNSYSRVKINKLYMMMLDLHNV
jgi:ABC-type lipoprotein release transport system permease subunit